MMTTTTTTTTSTTTSAFHQNTISMPVDLTIRSLHGVVLPLTMDPSRVRACVRVTRDGRLLGVSALSTGGLVRMVVVRRGKFGNNTTNNTTTALQQSYKAVWNHASPFAVEPIHFTATNDTAYRLHVCLKLPSGSTLLLATADWRIPVAGGPQRLALVATNGPSSKTQPTLLASSNNHNSNHNSNNSAYLELDAQLGPATVLEGPHADVCSSWFGTTATTENSNNNSSSVGSNSIVSNTSWESAMAMGNSQLHNAATPTTAANPKSTSNNSKASSSSSTTSTPTLLAPPKSDTPHVVVRQKNALLTHTIRPTVEKTSLHSVLSLKSSPSNRHGRTASQQTSTSKQASQSSSSRPHKSIKERLRKLTSPERLRKFTSPGRSQAATVPSQLPPRPSSTTRRLVPPTPSTATPPKRSALRSLSVPRQRPSAMDKFQHPFPSTSSSSSSSNSSSNKKKNSNSLRPPPQLKKPSMVSRVRQVLSPERERVPSRAHSNTASNNSALSQYLPPQTSSKQNTPKARLGRSIASRVRAITSPERFRWNTSSGAWSTDHHSSMHNKSTPLKNRNLPSTSGLTEDTGSYDGSESTDPDRTVDTFDDDDDDQQKQDEEASQLQAANPAFPFLSWFGGVGDEDNHTQQRERAEEQYHQRQRAPIESIVLHGNIAPGSKMQRSYESDVSSLRQGSFRVSQKRHQHHNTFPTTTASKYVLEALGLPTTRSEFEHFIRNDQGDGWTEFAEEDAEVRSREDSVSFAAPPPSFFLCQDSNVFREEWMDDQGKLDMFCQSDFIDGKNRRLLRGKDGNGDDDYEDDEPSVLSNESSQIRLEDQQLRQSLLKKQRERLKRRAMEEESLVGDKVEVVRIPQSVMRSEASSTVYSNKLGNNNNNKQPSSVAGKSDTSPVSVVDSPNLLANLAGITF